MIAIHGVVDGKSVEHLVTIQLRFIQSPSEADHKAKRAGWSYRQYQGRHAMERKICRPCMNAAEITEADARRVRQEHLKLEQESSGNRNVTADYNEEYV